MRDSSHVWGNERRLQVTRPTGGRFGKVLATAAWLWATSLSACPDAALTAKADDGRETAGRGQPWLHHRFVYDFSSAVAADPARQATFERACALLLGSTALQCTPRSRAPDDPDYVHVIDGGHDFSYIGRQGGCQVLSILTWNNPIVVAHEIKHALGWAHEQQHPDRERFIEVRFDAIPQRYRAEFQLRDLGNEGPYDFDSIMHFHPTDFARPGAVAFRPLPEFVGWAPQPGQRDHLSAIDLAEIRAVYGEAARP